MSDLSHVEPDQHFFEPHEIADLKDAFKVDEAAELKYLESKTSFFRCNIIHNDWNIIEMLFNIQKSTINEKFQLLE